MSERSIGCSFRGMHIPVWKRRCCRPSEMHRLPYCYHQHEELIGAGHCIPPGFRSAALKLLAGFFSRSVCDGRLLIGAFLRYCVARTRIQVARAITAAPYATIFGLVLPNIEDNFTFSARCNAHSWLFCICVAILNHFQDSCSRICSEIVCNFPR